MNGILLVNKPQAMTSFDVVAILRKTFGIRRIGHTGTLDPNATGLLVILLGKSTKLLPFLENQDKIYQCTLRFGRRTDTGDIWGKVLEESVVRPLKQEDVKEVLASFEGEQQQIPPMYSAVKIDGKKLYEYARKDIEIVRQPRTIMIHSIRLLQMRTDEIDLVVHCSKGTYIRTLCEDIAEKLSMVGAMAALHRTHAGDFSVDDAYSLEEIKEGRFNLLSTKEALSVYPYIEFEPIQDVLNGKLVNLETDADCVCIGHDDEVIAIYQRQTGNIFKCLRGLW